MCRFLRAERAAETWLPCLSAPELRMIGTPSLVGALAALLRVDSAAPPVAKGALLMIRLVPFALALLLAPACSPTKPDPGRKEICGNQVDDDSDGKLDCADPDCFDANYCQVILEDCGDNRDNDGDGDADCKDPDCLADARCIKLEVCGNKLDDDNDGFKDCQDSDCRSFQFCGDGGSEAGHCNDLLDNDNSGRIDCDDPACFGGVCGAGCVCTDGGVQGEGACGDAADNDVDGKTDCADADCNLQSCGPGCACVGGQRGEGLCGDGQDNDADSASDCADTDCAMRSCGTGCECGNLVKKETACVGGADDDGDNLIDCADPDCAAVACGTGCVCQSGAKRETACTDGADNDGDGKTDCTDNPDCDGTPCGTACVCQGGGKRETACGDGLDNDQDGTRDCADVPECTGAAGCGNPAQPEVGRCADNIDNDNDGDRDCQDSDCAGQSCGTGCACQAGAKRETACSDAADNDGDGASDCADPDCSNTGTELCTDEIDNDCDNQVDCGDSSCTGSGACTALLDGKACLSGGQCASGRCLTETTNGLPSGHCTNSAACSISLTTGASTGCASGGTCATDEFGTFCRKSCSGSTGCRGGYACHDDLDENDVTPNYCIPLCTSDLDCARLGGQYGCNLHSRRCETKDKGLAKLGAACAGNASCESGVCLRASSNGGYCMTRCKDSSPTCPGDGVCDYSSGGDNTGDCYDGCANAAECTRGGRYTCQSSQNNRGNVCYCAVAGDLCSTDADCCTGPCQNFGLVKICLF